MRPESRATEFIDTVLCKDNVTEIVAYKGSIHIITASTSVVFKGRALTQLLRLAGVNTREFRTDKDRVREAIMKLLEKKELFVRGLKLPSGAIYAVRVTTERYVPIPHKMLVEYVSELMGSRPAKVTKFRYRTVFMWRIGETSATRAYLAVSNANTGVDAIHVYGYLEILVCSNGLYSTKICGFASVPHVGTAQSVLEKVKVGIMNVLNSIRARHREFDERIRELERIRIEPSKVDEFLAWFRNAFARKYYSILLNAIKEFRTRYGDTLATLFQAVTYVIPRMQSEFASQRLSRIAETMVLERRMPI